ncbi:hypothetical protein AAE478_005057 [Parahypoxylon ruwenzoriense]
MDPVTVIGLIAAVVELVRATKSVIEVIKTVKDGDRDLSTLSHDVSMFTEALVGFDRVLRGRRTIHRISGPVIGDLLKHSTGIVEDLRTRLGQISNSGHSAVRRARWTQHKSSIKKLHRQLKEQNAMLHTFLSITHAETFLAITSQYPRFMLSTSALQAPGKDAKEEDGPRSKVGLLQVPEFNRRARRRSGSSMQTAGSVSDSASSCIGPPSIFSSAASFESVSSSNSMNPNSNHPANTPDPGEASLTTTTPDKVPQRNNHLIPQDMFLIRRACRYDCHCQCHEHNTTKSQRRFSNFKSRETQCTEPTCRGNAAIGDQFTHHSRSFRKALSQVLSAKSIKIRYDLKTYRMVPEGSDAMRHVKHGNLEKLKACIESGEATIWDTAPDGWSLLHTAAYNRQLPIVKYLIGLGADPEAGDVGSRNPADLAVLKSIGQDATKVEQSIVEVFSQNDDVLQDFEFTPIHMAVLKLYDTDDSERPSLEELIRVVDDANNAPPNTNWVQWKLGFRERSPLFSTIIEYFRASAFEQPKGSKIIHNLLDRKDKKYHWTPLHWAASSGRLDEMKILVEYGADPLILSNLDANILHAAAESKIDRGLFGALKIWKRCPDRLNINQANRWAETPLHVASWSSAACVKLLLEAGADPGLKEENGQVPLHCAGLSEQSPDRREIVTLLCKTETNEHINAQDFDGRPPIFDFLDDPECVEILIRHGAGLAITDYSGKNAFHHTCIQGESETLAALLRLSNEPDAVRAKSDDGNTPLIEALSMSNIECAMTLLKLDDVGDTVGKDGWAPVHYAAKIGDADLLSAVLKHPTFTKATKTLDGKRADVVAMEAGNWHGKVKDLVREYDSLNWTE